MAAYCGDVIEQSSAARQVASKVGVQILAATVSHPILFTHDTADGTVICNLVTLSYGVDLLHVTRDE